MIDRNESFPDQPNGHNAADSRNIGIPLLKTIALLVYAGAVALSVWLVVDGSTILGICVLVLSLLTIPFLAKGSFRERLRSSLVAIFSLGGLAFGIGVYLALFNVPWFERIFNDKGTGPLGLILFGVVFALGGVYLGSRLVGDITGRSKNMF